MASVSPSRIKRRRVVDAVAGVLGIADHDADPARLCSHPFQRRGDLPAQAVVKQQILGRIAAQREFGKQHQIGFEPVASFGRRVDDALSVAGDIADEQIELSECDAEGGRASDARALGLGAWGSGQKHYSLPASTGKGQDRTRVRARAR